MGPRADNRVFRFDGVCPPDAGLIHINMGVISFTIPQRIGFIIVIAFPKSFTWCRPYPAAEGDLRWPAR